MMDEHVKITVFDLSDGEPEKVTAYLSKFVPRADDRLFIGDTLYIVGMVTWGDVLGDVTQDYINVALFCERAR